MIIDFTDSNCSSPDHWFLNYFAYIASTPRNWIECYLEPNVRHPEIIDLYSPPPTYPHYPAAEMDLYWVVICLDGAPERVRASKNSFDITSAEHHFRQIIELQVAALGVRPKVKVCSNMRDGMLYGYECESTVFSLVRNIFKHCFEDNVKHPGNWEWHHHFRAGMGKSVRHAFEALVKAERNQLWARYEYTPLPIQKNILAA